MTKVSFIVITYNSANYIADCLYSIENSSYTDKEIIVVDNVSTDNTVQLIENTFKNVILIKSKSNRGFAGGCNTGYKHASGDFIALVNPDVSLDKDWLAQLLSYATGPLHTQAGMFASKMINANSNPPVIDTAGDGCSTLLKGFKRGEGESISLYDTSEYIFGACAGATLYRRSMLEDIGFFDEDFFLLHEDSDLNLRAQVCGWKVLYVPTAIVYHKVRSSIGHMSDIAVYYTLRNIEFVKIKNIPLGLFLRYLPELLIGMLTEFYYYTIRHKHFRLYMKAKFHALKMLPDMYRKRKLIMEKKKVTNQYLIGLMTPIWKSNFIKSKFKKLIKD